MRIKLSPIRMDASLVVTKEGNKLTLNGEVYDFAGMPDGILPEGAIESIWIIGNIIKQDGELTITLVVPLPANYTHAQAFPDDLFDVPDGFVEFPAADANNED